jgi:hypothetical protein
VIPACTACGALRAPLSTSSVNLAGKSSRVGGIVEAESTADGKGDQAAPRTETARQAPK